MPKLTRKAIPSTGISQHYLNGVAIPRFSTRITVNNRRTWRRLKATTIKNAIAEANQTAYVTKAKNFTALAQLWMDAGCPGNKSRPAIADQVEEIKGRARKLIGFFGKFDSNEIRLFHLPQYAVWRRKQMIRKSFSGGRMVDLDLVTLSNILRYGIFNGMLEFNHIRSGRPRYQENVRHARVVMPESAEAIHKIAHELLSYHSSEINAWLAFFSEFTGCRTSELLRLRTDAKNKQDAGFIEWLSENEKKERTDDTVGHLYLGRRSKNGMNPWAKIGPEFAEMIRAFETWRKTRKRYRTSVWFFPNRFNNSDKGPLGPTTFGNAVARAAKILELPHITPHGFRAFYATKRLRDGARTIEIAAEIGDKTVSLIETIYADNPDGRKLWWVPEDSLPTWQKWVPAVKEKEPIREATDI